MQITAEAELTRVRRDLRRLRHARRIEAAEHVLLWALGAVVASLLIGIVGAAFLDAADFYAPQASVSGDE